MSHCLLTGGSSQIGYYLLPKLLAADADVQVLALARRRMPDYLCADPRLHWHLCGELTATQHQSDDLVVDPATVTEMISLGPVQLVQHYLPRCHRLRHLQLLTSSSVLTKTHSGSRAEREQIQALARAEQDIVQQCSQRDIVCQVLRPTMIYGAGLDANVCALASMVERTGVVPVVGAAPGLRQPVHAADLADAILTLREHAHSGIWQLAGATQLSYRMLATQVCETLGKGRVRSLPYAVLAAMLGIAQLFGKLPTANSAMLRRQHQDLVFDNAPARRDWGWAPREFQLQPQMLQRPLQPYAVQLTRLFHEGFEEQGEAG
ncbi:MAG: NAD(P)-dependent oxidoreductase [Gammaproteobacteria bacterium]|jgi:nucleoside-diphosphate-sugar epimerase|nr:NAD(P)-dependent oxidoreductase [Gammaproteobacteria bacterium]